MYIMCLRMRVYIVCVRAVCLRSAGKCIRVHTHVSVLTIRVHTFVCVLRICVYTHVVCVHCGCVYTHVVCVQFVCVALENHAAQTRMLFSFLCESCVGMHINLNMS